ncbi:hypothetical protein [Actinoalloteichus caeruleus]|uniref:Uncharacterized protein n=1 Tax=Actinoalloteichus caeruleus DSM 43889 TaxID=1120930 RepID=A0ABT1JE21_ACTCY|nr:hypothetical protein [Actinoalloteichus caeruleus]MCP2330744.1 hypothetical protein [Actinoalloteichus caeruleus DSM 43889]
MRIWHLARTDRCDVEETVAGVVVASSEDEARQLMAAIAGWEQPECWHDPDRVTCIPIGTADEGAVAGVVLRDYVEV